VDLTRGLTQVEAIQPQSKRFDGTRLSSGRAKHCSRPDSRIWLERKKAEVDVANLRRLG